MPRPFFASYLTISHRCHTMTASKAGDSREPNIEAVGRPQRRAKSQGVSPRLCYWGGGMRFLSGRRSRPRRRGRRGHSGGGVLGGGVFFFFSLPSALGLVAFFLGPRAAGALSRAGGPLPDNLSDV